MRTGSVSTAAVAALSSFAFAAAASPHALAGGLTHAGDIILTTDAGSIATNAMVSGALEPRRVFASSMGDLVPGVASDPGFDCFPATFPAGSSIGFRILDALRAWNGSDFSTIPGARLGVSFLNLGPVLTPTAAETIVEGFTVPVQSGGVWHRHFTYAVDFDAPAGVYLLELQLRSTSASIAASEPFWLVFDNDANANDYAAALAWAQQNLGAPPVVCEGDTNGDNVVNFADLNAVLSTFGQSGAGLAGDVDANGVVNFADLNTVLSNFGRQCD